MSNEVTHGVDTVVRGRVELSDVERGAFGDLNTALAHTARLAINGTRTVECLGQDTSGRGLAGATRPGEEVGVADLAIGNGPAKGHDHVGLATKGSKGSRPVAAVPTPVQI